MVGCLDAVVDLAEVCCWLLVLALREVGGMEAVMDRCFCLRAIGFSQGLFCCLVERRDVLVLVEKEGLIVRDALDDTDDHVLLDLGVVGLVCFSSSSF